jgi:hypothetical protein
VRVELDGTIRWGTSHLVEPDPLGLFDLLRWRWNRWRESWH